MAHVINLVMQAELNALNVVEDKPESTFIDGVDITNLDDVVNGGEMNVLLETRKRGEKNRV